MCRCLARLFLCTLFTGSSWSVGTEVSVQQTKVAIGGLQLIWNLMTVESMLRQDYHAMTKRTCFLRSLFLWRALPSAAVNAESWMPYTSWPTGCGFMEYAHDFACIKFLCACNLNPRTPLCPSWSPQSLPRSAGFLFGCASCMGAISIVYVCLHAHDACKLTFHKAATPTCCPLTTC